MKIENQTCTKCKIKKPISEFHFRKERGNYYKMCKRCRNSGINDYNENNRELVNKRATINYQKNREKRLEWSKKYRTENKEKLKEQNKRTRERNKKQRSEYNTTYIKNRLKNDIGFKIKSNCSRAIRSALKKSNGSKNNITFLKFVCYSSKELKNHMELLFEPWMSWDNYKMYNNKTWDDNDSNTWTWVIDHIIPQSKLPYTSMEDDNFKKCWALENLRPYSAKQNMIDSDRKK